MTESNELVVVEPANIPALFVKDGCDPLLKRLHEELDKFEPDITTAKGRKEIASFANKFSKAKTLIDGHGKALVEEEKTRLKIVDAERKKFRDECDIMKQEARKPLTDWEDAEKKRVADIEERIENIQNHPETAFNDPAIRELTSFHVGEALEQLKNIVIDDSFEEFELAATKAKEAALTQLEAKFIVLQNAEKEKAEADRIEKERLEKEQKDREKKIAKEAAEIARKEAVKEAEEKGRKENEKREKLKKEKLQLKLAKEKAERETKEAKKRAEGEKIEAAKQAEKDRKQAIEDEKKRQADQIKKDKEADEKRHENKRHCGKINREAKASFVAEGYNEEEAENIVKLIASNKIKNATINY